MPVEADLGPYLMFDLRGPLTIEGQKKPMAEDAAITLLYSSEDYWVDSDCAIVPDKNIKDSYHLWICVPKNHQFKDGQISEIPFKDLADEAGKIRIIAGDYKGLTGPIDGSVIILWDILMNANHTLSFDLREDIPAYIFLIEGEVSEQEGQLISKSELATFESVGSQLTLTATKKSRFLIISAETFNEPSILPGPPKID